MRHSHYILACLVPLLLSCSVFGDKSTQEYLTEGNAYLTGGKYNEALTSFDAAIRQEPDNYLSYFKRATAYLSLGRHHAAVDDFSTILNLKPDFDNAYLQRARIYTQEGHFDLALHDLNKYLENHVSDKKAQTMLHAVQSAQEAMRKARIEKSEENYEECITLTTAVSRTCPLLAEARLLRAQCHVGKGEIDEAAGDYARAAQLNPSDADILLILSKINFYLLNEPQGALTHVKQCLHYDPEQKECKKLFRQIKKINKELASIETDIQSKRWATAANHLIGTANRQGLLQDIDLELEALETQLALRTPLPKRLHATCYRLACQLYGQQGKDDTLIQKWCTLALAEKEDGESLLYRGGAYLRQKEYEDAVRDLEKAHTMLGRSDGRARTLLQQAQQKLKQSKKIDYYKLLDVSPNADTREIKKAYRKKAHEWHPDKYSGDLDKEKVERKMADINQAYAVLSDADMRQQYDNGYDPYDPEKGSGGPSPFQQQQQQQQQGGFHFQNGFPFGGNFPGGGQGGAYSFQF
ncbi:uncharacterized protein EV154DRAFT_494661 [Mucor mucedo]|uniref:uncharacterized protein n=1 Tax=Mucor mucedo TaxID=29922 RepID=UPI00221EA29A|nr:uncharacterized protein EV154DRAFT_494661 [Mucor mucedo]KAI7895704.1 hypothetical protein EV154DRAFT_494661 [Mucor mucedo]